MKSLNKKISAIVLAGMVVMGGVLSSGVSSFAASANNKVSVQENPDKRVEFYCREYGKIIGYDNDEKNLEKIYSSIYNKKKCYNNGKSIEVKYPSQIPKYLFNAKCKKYKFVKIKFKDLYYLIQIK